MEIISVVSKAKTKKGRSSSGPFEIRYQEADFIMPIRRVRALETRTPHDGEYPPGLYILAAESFSITNGISLPLSPIARGTAPGKVCLACMATGSSRNSHLVSTGHMGGRLWPPVGSL